MNEDGGVGGEIGVGVVHRRLWRHRCQRFEKLEASLANPEPKEGEGHAESPFFAAPREESRMRMSENCAVSLHL